MINESKKVYFKKSKKEMKQNILFYSWKSKKRFEVEKKEPVCHQQGAWASDIKKKERWINWLKKHWEFNSHVE